MPELPPPNIRNLLLDTGTRHFRTTISDFRHTSGSWECPSSLGSKCLLVAKIANESSIPICFYTLEIVHLLSNDFCIFFFLYIDCFCVDVCSRRVHDLLSNSRGFVDCSFEDFFFLYRFNRFWRCNVRNISSKRVQDSSNAQQPCNDLDDFDFARYLPGKSETRSRNPEHNRRWIFFRDARKSLHFLYRVAPPLILYLDRVNSLGIHNSALSRSRPSRSDSCFFFFIP